MTTTTSDRDKASLSGNLPAGFDPATELARLKGSDDAEQSNAPQHQSEEAVAAAGNSEERARYLSFVDGPAQGAHTDAIVRHGKFGDFSINNGGGAITEVNGITAREREEEEDKERADEIGERFDEMRREELERWRESRHTFAGATLTGEEWDELGDELKADTPARKWLVERLKKQGKTQAEAEKKATEMADVYKAQGKPEAQRTDAENAAIKAAETDPDYTRNTAALTQERAAGFPSVNASERTVGNAQTITSVGDMADSLKAEPATRPRETRTISSGSEPSKGRGDFPSAPDLVAHHEAAKAATEPLERPKAPVQIAAATLTAPTPSDSGGFGV